MTKISPLTALFNTLVHKCKWLTLLLTFFLSLISFSSNALSLAQLKNIDDITQDNKGYIWLSGQHGLSRFDGHSLINFANNSRSWQTPFIWTHDIHLKEQSIIIATENQGVWEMDPKNGQVVPINEALNKRTVYHATYFENNYYIYTLAPREIHKYNPLTDTTTIIAQNVKIKDFLHYQNKLYIYNENGIFQVEEHGLSAFNNKKVQNAVVINNKIIGTNETGIFALNQSGNVTANTQLSGVNTVAVSDDKKHIFVITKAGEISLYDENLIKIEHRYNAPVKHRVHKIFHDRSKTLWLISNQGAQRISQSNIKDHQKLFNTSSNSMVIDQLKNSLILGSYGAGLQNFDENNKVLPTTINDGFSKKVKRLTDIKVIEDDIYLATFDGLWRYQTKNGQLSQLDIGNNNQILLKLTYQNNSLYIGTDEDGFIIYDLKAGKVKDIINKEYTFSSNEIIDILPVDDANIWLATAKGIDIYHPHTKNTEAIVLPITSKVISLTKANNKIFAATKGNGIFVFNHNKTLITRIAQDMNFSYIRYINGKIWAPTRQGIYTISPETYQISLIPNTEKYVFSSEPIRFKNKIYAPHYGGVLEIPLYEQSHFNAPIHISKTTVSGMPTIESSIVKVSSTSDVISFELASMDYRPGKEKEFQYQINGEAWNTVYGNQFSLTGLGSGTYRITVRGTNSLGQWSKVQAFTQIEVAYPWYWSPKLRILYLVTIVMSILMAAWLLILRAKSIKQIHSILTSDIQKRGKVSLNVSKSLAHAIELLSKHQDDISKLANIENAKEIIKQAVLELDSQSNTKEPDSLQGKSLTIALPYLADYIHRKYHINVATKIDIDDHNIRYELQADIYKIIWEALTSAIINGNGSNFIVNMQEFKGKLWLTISDDKTSFIHFKNKINFDMAMYYIRQIANKYSASINTFDEHENGSQLVISIPLMKLT